MKRFYKNYIQGAYHCDTCPYCWEERGYEAWRIRSDFDDYCNPFEAKTLRMEWQDLIKKTWGRFIGRFKPYFCD